MTRDRPPPDDGAPPGSPRDGGGYETSDTVDVHGRLGKPARPRRPSEAPPLEPGAQLVERYTVLGVLGKGGMGVVYSVYDAKLDRKVALKLLRARQLPGSGTDASSGEQRLLREAKAMARLSHPNVVSVYDVGALPDGGVFVAMELVDGLTLTQWLRREKRAWPAILELFVAAGRGLAAAHQAGMVHRDFKCDNVLVGVDGRVRVTDFGVVRLDLDEAEPPAPASQSQSHPAIVAELAEPADSGRVVLPSDLTSSGSWQVALTQAGTAPGTPRYMAPEIFDLKVADPRSDLFSFCVALFEALIGQHPFDDEMAGHAMQRAPLPADVALPPWLLRAVESGLERSPDARPPTMDALLTRLTPPLPRDRTRGLWMAGVAMVGMALAGWGALGWRARAVERAELCQGGARHFAGIWDDPGKQRVHAALLHSGEPYAEDVWKNVAATLDRYAGRWAAMHKDSCEATRLRGEQSDAVMTLRMACLDRRLGGMSALVDVLAQPDGVPVDKAATAAAGLGAIEQCGDVSALLAETPPPRDPAMQKEVAIVRKLLAHAEALRLASRMPDGATLAAQAVAAARASGDSAIVTEALAEEGQLRLSFAPERAAELLTEAFWAAFAAKLDRVATAAAIRLTHAQTLMSRFDRAADWQKYAQAGLKRIDGDEELEAELWATLGYGFDQRSQYDNALGAYQKAARLSEHRFGLDDVRTLRRQNDELTALTNSQHVLEARGKRLALLSRQVALLGPHHPIVARSLMDLGDDEVHIGHLDEARAHLLRAEQIYREAGVTGSRYWMALKLYLAQLALDEGRFADATAAADEALATLERGAMQTSEEALELRGLLARAALGRGHADEAVAALQQALADGARVHGAQSPTLGPLQAALADADRLAGKLLPAQLAAERAVALALQQSGEGSFDVAEARVGLAEVDVARGQAAAALTLLDGNEPALLRALGDQAPLVMRAQRTRGDALAALGRFGDAATALTAANAIGERAGVDPAQRQATRLALAKVNARNGDGGKLAARPAR
jgi:serine/threonine protein kinase/tetratricopeptide (TPR) repeat protein